MSQIDELERLHALLQKGALTTEEFELAKKALLTRASASDARGLRSLAKSKTDTVLFGVCGALGQATAIPSWAWRMAFAAPLILSWGVGGLAAKYGMADALSILSGLAIALYVALGFALPDPANRKEEAGSTTVQPTPQAANAETTPQKT